MNQTEQDSIEYNLFQRHLKNFLFHFCNFFSHFEKNQERKSHFHHCKNKVICYHLVRTILKPWAQLESGIHEPSGELAQIWSESIQTSSDKDSENPDSSVLTLSGQTDRQGKLFSKIWTALGQLTDTEQNFPEIRTKTRQGQDTDSAVRRLLSRSWISRNFLILILVGPRLLKIFRSLSGSVLDFSFFGSGLVRGSLAWI